MDNFFKKIGDDIAGAAEQAEIDATVERELAASIAEIEEQAEEEVEITPEDPGLEIADAGQRPEEMRTQKEIRDYNRRVIEVSNAIKERNLEEGNKPTRSPEESSYGKRRRRRKYGKKKKKKAGKKRKTSVVKGVKGIARDVKKTVKKVGRGAKKIVKRVDKGANKVAKGLRSIFTEKRSFGRSATPMPTSIEDYEKVQGYDPRSIVMQSLFGKRKKKFGCSTCGCSGFGKRRRYKFGAGCHGKETFGTKCTSQCPECGNGITGFDPMTIVQKKLSYGKRKRKRKSSFGKKTSKKPSAATRKLCKRLKVRLTIKRGGKRVYKSEKMLKKQCKTAMKRKKKKTVKRRKRKSSFGKMTKQEINAITLQYLQNNTDKLKELKDYARTGEQCMKDAKTLAGLSVVGTGVGLGYRGYQAYKRDKRKKKRQEAGRKAAVTRRNRKKWRKAAAKRRKRKPSFGKKAKKPSAALKKLCKKHKVRLTMKRGGKRVYKSDTMLKKQCKKAMKKR